MTTNSNLLNTDDTLSDILRFKTANPDSRTPLLQQSGSQDAIATCSFKGDPFSRSLSIKRHLKTEKIYCFEAFAHFLKGNIGSGYKFIFYSYYWQLFILHSELHRNVGADVCCTDERFVITDL